MNGGKSAELLGMLEAYGASDFVPFHMPGHKRRLGSMPDPFSIDITEIEGFDDLHHPEGILRELQEQSASLYGAGETHFLINGSTAGILTAISAICSQARAAQRPPELIIGRNAHRSAYHGAYLARAHLVYLVPEAGEWPMYGRISPACVEEALKEHPDAAAVYITSPTYEGVVSDIEEIAKITHRHGRTLIVDEAHGAHFGMHRDLPESAVRLGADLVIQSLHKTLPSLTQTALLHVCGDRVDPGLVRRFLSVYQTSSPSYVLMASIDQCIRVMRELGTEIFDRLLESVRELERRAKTLQYVRLEKADDPIRFLVSAPGRLSGRLIYDTLRQACIEPEMYLADHVLCLGGAGDTSESIARLAEALEMVDRQAGSACAEDGARDGGENADFTAPSSLPEQVMDPGDAWDAPMETVPLAGSIGRTAGSFVYMYPPGTPLLVPGERIDDRIYECLRTGANSGCRLHGLQSLSGILQIKVTR